MRTTVVIFRRFKDDDSIVALFPYEIADSSGNCVSYMHVGQHGPANYNHCVQSSAPARPQEYAQLRKELESIGYKLIVRKKRGAK